jgi:hypothetical protein
MRPSHNHFPLAGNAAAHDYGRKRILLRGKGKSQVEPCHERRPKVEIQRRKLCCTLRKVDLEWDPTKMNPTFFAAKQQTFPSRCRSHAVKENKRARTNRRRRRPRLGGRTARLGSRMELRRTPRTPREKTATLWHILTPSALRPTVGVRPYLKTHTHRCSRSMRGH